jgi:PTS system N-acetylgalactosamine-specific IIA component
VFLTDLLGGRHFASLQRWRCKTGREVITGTNLQLLLEMVLERDDLSSEAFRCRRWNAGIVG